MDTSLHHRIIPLCLLAIGLTFVHAVSARAQQPLNQPSLSLASTSHLVEWDSIIQISHDTLDDYTPSVFLAGDTVHIFWYGRTGCCDAHYARSINGGLSFSHDTTIIVPTTSGGWVTPEGFSFGVSGSNAYVLTTEFEVDSNSVLHYYPAMVRSTDGGHSWDSLRRISDSSGSSFVAQGTLAVYKESLAVIFTSQNPVDTVRFGILASLDAGASWPVKQSVPSGGLHAGLFLNSYGIHYFGTISFDPADELLYLRSANLGQYWSDSAILSPPLYFSDEPSLSGTDDNTIYTAWRDDIYGITCGGYNSAILFRRSVNNGFSWENIQVLTADQNPSGNDPAIASSDSVVAVAWEDCVGDTAVRPVVRFSLDRGVSWSDLMPLDSAGGIIGMAVSDSALHVVWEKGFERPNGHGDVYYRRGRISNVTAVTEAISLNAFSLRQNYPNPFNPNTVIEYHVPIRTHVRLKVFDLTGRVVATLVDGVEEPGMKTVNMEADGLAAGVYYYRLQTGTFSESRKLVLLK